jgi:hypothetical protein
VQHTISHYINPSKLICHKPSGIFPSKNWFPNVDLERTKTDTYIKENYKTCIPLGSNRKRDVLRRGSRHIKPKSSPLNSNFSRPSTFSIIAMFVNPTACIASTCACSTQNTISLAPCISKWNASKEPPDQAVTSTGFIRTLKIPKTCPMSPKLELGNPQAIKHEKYQN